MELRVVSGIESELLSELRHWRVGGGVFRCPEDIRHLRCIVSGLRGVCSDDALMTDDWQGVKKIGAVTTALSPSLSPHLPKQAR